jgi:oxygen-independent coproporphyrinogen-3 oxidase
VSNFCKPGFQCRHNLNYWHEGEYIGLGAAAASHIGGCRYKNAADVAAYLAAPTGIRTDSEWLEPETKAGEEAILRLRLLNEGVSPAELQSKYGQAAKGVINNLEELACRGKLIRRSSRYVLPQSMVMMSNPILAQVLC